jgi:hypothetical protein
MLCNDSGGRNARGGKKAPPSKAPATSVATDAPVSPVKPVKKEARVWKKEPTAEELAELSKCIDNLQCFSHSFILLLVVLIDCFIERV